MAKSLWNDYKNFKKKWFIRIDDYFLVKLKYSFYYNYKYEQ